MASQTTFDRYPDTRGLKEAKGGFHADVKTYKRKIKDCRIAFHGTVKIYGCNITILFSSALPAPQFQSRDKIITPEDDCYGAAAVLTPLTPIIKSILKTVVPAANNVMIAGEWAGKGIQEESTAAVAELEPFYTIFGIRVDGNWLDRSAWEWVWFPQDIPVFNIYEFKTYDLIIDFMEERDAGGGKRALELAEEVQECCPVALMFGKINGVGEGIVWTEEKKQAFQRDPRQFWKPLKFKTKGSLFTTTSGAPPSEGGVGKEIAEIIEKFVAFAVPPARLDQALLALRDGGKKTMIEVLKDKSNINKLASLVYKDVLKEEMTEMKRVAINKEKKEVNKAIIKVAKKHFLTMSKGV